MNGKKEEKRNGFFFVLLFILFYYYYKLTVLLDVDQDGKPDVNYMAIA